MLDNVLMVMSHGMCYFSQQKPGWTNHSLWWLRLLTCKSNYII